MLHTNTISQTSTIRLQFNVECVSLTLTSVTNCFIRYGEVRDEQQENNVVWGFPFDTSSWNKQSKQHLRQWRVVAWLRTTQFMSFSTMWMVTQVVEESSLENCQWVNSPAEVQILYHPPLFLSILVVTFCVVCFYIKQEMMALTGFDSPSSLLWWTELTSRSLAWVQ